MRKITILLLTLASIFAPAQNVTTPPVTGVNQYFSVTGCTTAQSTDSNCTGTITLPTAYPDNAYFIQMTPNSINGAFIAVSVSGTLAAGSFPYTLTCTFNCAAIVAPTIYVFTHHN
jgi:hypothetical protein